MTKRCPISTEFGPSTWAECIREECAWWYDDFVLNKDKVLVDEEWCAIREIASKLGYLRSLNKEY